MSGMFTTYDAKAVAEVMGIDFVPRRTRAATAASRSGKKGADVASGGGTSSDPFVIEVDGGAMLIRVTIAGGAKRATGSGRASSRVSDRVGRLISPTYVFIEKAVQSGLPRQALRRVAECLANGHTSKASALEWSVVPKSTLERRATRLSPQESERTERMARLFVHARRALGTAREAREFMIARHPELERRSPEEAARTEIVPQAVV